MQIKAETVVWRDNHGTEKKYALLDSRTREVVVEVGDMVTITSTAHYKGDPRTKFEVGKDYEIAMIYSDKIFGLKADPAARGSATGDYVEIDCCSTIEVSEEELEAVYKSLGVKR